ncbi:MAG: bifunctional DNA-formamidopyrimidine glycosylase/DNA-(apurinic or apyrimidinic site) lyase [Candidatus Paceibacterota bacterium]
MPELPEVETLKRELQKSLSGQRIAKVQVLWPKTIKPLSPLTFQERLANQKISGLSRRAKMLILELGEDQHVAFHLKMTGQLIFVPKIGNLISGGHPTNDVQTPGRHTRLIFHFQNGDVLYFNDLRKFGWARLLNKDELISSIEHYGPEPLEKDFTQNYLENLFSKYPKRTVKQILLDQTLIAGIGNIYADEACFLAGILPNRKAGKITNSESKKLHQKIIDVLNLSIKHKGTSSRNYRRSTGEKGNFVKHLNVYGRANQVCKNCKTQIEKIKHAGRGTHFCPKCQK